MVAPEENQVGLPGTIPAPSDTEMQWPARKIA
jgi:hypothetical protein